jgi:DNA-binding MarR family transcriptional regulator
LTIIVLDHRVVRVASALDPIEHEGWWDEVVLPGLMASARTTYGQAMRAALRRAGFDDMPPRGMGLVGGIARNGPIAQQELPRALSTSKQSASQLVETLVQRGYLERSADPDDRRRVVLTLTDKGQKASKITAGALDRIDAALGRHVTAEDVAATRRVLGVLSVLGERARERARTEH